MIACKNLSFAYGKNLILDDISFDLNDGDFLAVLGANATGKTTLLKLLSAYLKPLSGDIFINDKNIKNISALSLAKMRAVLEQYCNLTFNYTLLETVLLGNYAFSKTDNLNTFALELLKNLGLDKLADFPYINLSGGQQRRAQLARTLLQLGQNPSKKVLLLDEPSAGLDPAHSHIALASAKELTKKNCTVISILHDPNLAIAYANKVAILKNSKLLAFGDKADVLTKANLEEAYSTKCEIIDNRFINFPAS